MSGTPLDVRLAEQPPGRNRPHRERAPPMRVAVRSAAPADAARVGELLRASYSTLLAASHEPSLLARALPHMI